MRKKRREVNVIPPQKAKKEPTANSLVRVT
jgi:hypothetical protein